MKYFITKQDEFIKLLENAIEVGQVNEANEIDDFLDMLAGKKTAKDMLKNQISGNYDRTRKRTQKRHDAKTREDELDIAIRAEVAKRKGSMYIDENGEDIKGTNLKGQTLPERAIELSFYADRIIKLTKKFLNSEDKDKKAEEKYKNDFLKILVELNKYEKDCTAFKKISQIFSDVGVKNTTSNAIKKKSDKYHNSVRYYTTLFTDDLEEYFFNYYEEKVRQDFKGFDDEDIYEFLPIISSKQLSKEYEKLVANGFSSHNFLSQGIDKDTYIMTKFTREYTPFAGNHAAASSFFSKFFGGIIPTYIKVARLNKHQTDFTYKDYERLAITLIDATKKVPELGISTGKFTRITRMNMVVNTTMLVHAAIKSGYDNAANWSNWEEGISILLDKISKETHEVENDEGELEVKDWDIFYQATKNSYITEFTASDIYSQLGSSKEKLVTILGLKVQAAKSKKAQNKLKKGTVEKGERSNKIPELEEWREEHILGPSNSVDTNFCKKYLPTGTTKTRGVEKFYTIFKNIRLDLGFSRGKYLKTYIDEIRNPIIIAEKREEIIETEDEDRMAILNENILLVFAALRDRQYGIRTTEKLVEYVLDLTDEIDMFRTMDRDINDVTNTYTSERNKSVAYKYAKEVNRINQYNLTDDELLIAFEEYHNAQRINFYKENLKEIRFIDEKDIEKDVKTVFKSFAKIKKEKITVKEKTLYDKFVASGPLSIESKKKVFDKSLKYLGKLINSNTAGILRKDLDIKKIDAKSKDEALKVLNKIAVAVVDYNGINFNIKDEEEQTSILIYNLANIIRIDDDVSEIDDVYRLVEILIDSENDKVNNDSIIKTMFKDETIEDNISADED